MRVYTLSRTDVIRNGCDAACVCLGFMGEVYARAVLLCSVCALLRVSREEERQR